MTAKRESDLPKDKDKDNKDKKDKRRPSRFSEALNQAKEQLRSLGSKNQGVLLKARNLLKAPGGEARKRLANEKILGSLRKLGVATQSEVEALKKRIEELESTK